MDKVSNLSRSSIESIEYAINNFENFCMEKYGKADLIPELKTSSEEEVYDVLQNWINFNNSKAPATMQVYFSRLRKYLHYMGIKLNDQDIKAELTFKHKVEEERYGLTLNDIQTIFKEMKYKHKVQYLCQLSSLMRIGEIIQLRKKHLILGQKNIIVKIPSSITKFNKGRTTFFSKEASKMLMPILKELDDNDLVFGSSDNPKFSAEQNKLNSQSATKQVLRLAVKKTGLTQVYDSTGRYLINTHSFRAYGITKLSRHDPNFAKKIAGQKGYLLQYDRMSDEEKLELYEKFESDLIIDNSEKQKAEIKKLEDEKLELKKAKTENEIMKDDERFKGLIMESLLENEMADKVTVTMLKEAMDKMKAMEKTIDSLRKYRIEKSDVPQIIKMYQQENEDLKKELEEK
ncbi:tyrosine-type recombinase/integrase [Nitrosopumilus sp. S6]